MRQKGRQKCDTSATELGLLSGVQYAFVALDFTYLKEALNSTVVETDDLIESLRGQDPTDSERANMEWAANEMASSAAKLHAASQPGIVPTP